MGVSARGNWLWYFKLKESSKVVIMAGRSLDVNCPTCGKGVKARGLASHQRIMHGPGGGVGVVAAPRTGVSPRPSAGVPVYFVNNGVADPKASVGPMHVKKGSQGSVVKSGRYDTHVEMAEGAQRGDKLWVSSLDIVEQFIEIVP